MIEFARNAPQPPLSKRAMKSILALAFAILFAAAVHAQTDAPVITRAPVAADEKVSAAPAADTAALADLREQNKKLSSELALAWKENDQLKTSALTQVAAANQKTEAVQADVTAKNKALDDLKAQLASSQKSLDDLHKSAGDTASLTAANADRDKLAADLLKSSDEKSSLAAQLEAAQHDLAVQNQKLADLEAAQKSAPAQADVAVAPAPAVDSSELDDLKKQAAESEDKLNTSLHSYTLLSGENDQLKDALAKANDEKTALAAQLDDTKRELADLTPKAAAATASASAAAASASAAANELAAVRDQLRQTQNLVAQLASENSDLKTHLALNSNSTTSPAPAPSRLAPTPVPVPPPAAPVAAATPPPAAAGPHTYKVVSGDTLAKISKQYYGSSSRWPEILAANHDKLHDDKSLRIGMELKIP
jgi:LysM repeat protein